MCVNNLPKVVTCFSFFVFILCCSAFISIGERVLLSCVRFSFFHASQETGLARF